MWMNVKWNQLQDHADERMFSSSPFLPIPLSNRLKNSVLESSSPLLYLLQKMLCYPEKVHHYTVLCSEVKHHKPTISLS